MNEPTTEGIKRYPPAGYYHDYTFEEDLPCTCLASCDSPCHGIKCKCIACKAVYDEVMSSRSE